MKTPFDLTDFLSKPATAKARSWSRFSMAKRPAVAEVEEDDQPAEPLEKS